MTNGTSPSMFKDLIIYQAQKKIIPEAKNDWWCLLLKVKHYGIVGCDRESHNCCYLYDLLLKSYSSSLILHYIFASLQLVTILEMMYLVRFKQRLIVIFSWMIKDMQQRRTVLPKNSPFKAPFHLPKIDPFTESDKIILTWNPLSPRCSV